MLLVIDNYDSFTYNLVQYFGELGEEIRIFPNDKISLAQIEALNPQRICISPGPCTPRESGISKEVIQQFGVTTPLLGVCLGHQCIGEVFGAKVVRASRLMHGKTSPVYHEGKGLFQGIPNPIQATRYHSLIIDPQTIPSNLVVNAWTDQKEEIMAISHRHYPIYGVQFHPESILTKEGKKMLRNFLEL